NIDFNALPRNTLERLVGCLGGSAYPAPILADKSSYVGALVGWIFLLILSVVVLLAAVLADFGSLYSGIQGGEMIALYAIAIFFMVLSVLSLIRRIVLQKSLPFAPGRYLFPMDYVDARNSRLRIIPTALLSDLKGVHHHTN